MWVANLEFYPWFSSGGTRIFKIPSGKSSVRFLPCPYPRGAPALASRGRPALASLRRFVCNRIEGFRVEIGREDMVLDANVDLSCGIAKQ